MPPASSSAAATVTLALGKACRAQHRAGRCQTLALLLGEEAA
jgi:hypothetical protein